MKPTTLKEVSTLDWIIYVLLVVMLVGFVFLFFQNRKLADRLMTDAERDKRQAKADAKAAKRESRKSRRMAKRDERKAKREDGSKRRPVRPVAVLAGVVVLAMLSLNAVSYSQVSNLERQLEDVLTSESGSADLDEAEAADVSVPDDVQDRLDSLNTKLEALNQENDELEARLAELAEESDSSPPATPASTGSGFDAGHAGTDPECAEEVRYFAEEADYQGFFGPEVTVASVEELESELERRVCQDPALLAAVGGYLEVIDVGMSPSAQAARVDDYIDDRDLWRGDVERLMDFVRSADSSIETSSGPYWTMYMDTQGDIPRVHQYNSDTNQRNVWRIGDKELQLKCGFQPREPKPVPDVPAEEPPEAPPPPDEPPPPPEEKPKKFDVTVKKVAKGDAPADADYGFKLVCEDEITEFGLADGEITSSGFEEDTECTLTETEDHGADDVSFSVNPEGSVTGTSDTSVSFTVGSDVSITTVNEFEEEKPEPEFKCVSLVASPTSGEAPLDVSFEGEGYVDGTEIESYIFDFGDGESETTPSSTTSHQYTEVGNYTATLLIQTGEGTTTETADCKVSIKVEEEPEPEPEPKCFDEDGNPVFEEEFCGTPDDGPEQQEPRDDEVDETPGYEEGDAEETHDNQDEAQECIDSGECDPHDPTEDGVEVPDSEDGGEAPGGDVDEPDEQENDDVPNSGDDNPEHDGEEPTENPDEGTGDPEDTPAEEDEEDNEGDPLDDLDLPNVP